MPKTPIFYLEDSYEEELDKNLQQLLDQLNDTTKPKFLISVRDFFKKVFEWLKKIYNKSPIKINKQALKENLDSPN